MIVGICRSRSAEINQEINWFYEPKDFLHIAGKISEDTNVKGSHLGFSSFYH